MNPIPTSGTLGMLSPVRHKWGTQQWGAEVEGSTPVDIDMLELVESLKGEAAGTCSSVQSTGAGEA